MYMIMCSVQCTWMNEYCIVAVAMIGELIVPIR
jgi:hypothetical protein